MRKVREIKSKDCEVTASSLEASLSHFGIRVHPVSDIAAMIREMHWLGSFPPDAVQPDAAHKADRDRSLIAFPLVEQSRRIAVALDRARTIRGAKEKVLRVKKQINRLTTQDSAAQDVLFELEIGGRLLRPGVRMVFDEPDIVITDPTDSSLTIGVACKRPHNVDRLKERVREGANQIQAHPHSGNVIVVDVEPLFHKFNEGDVLGDQMDPWLEPDEPTDLPDPGPSDVEPDEPTDPLPAVRHWVGEPELVKASAEGILAAAVQAAHSDIEYAFQKGVDGIVFCGIVVGWSRTMHHWSWICTPISAPSATEFAEIIAQGLFPDAED